MKRWLTPGLILLLVVAAPLLLAGKGDATQGKEVYTKRCATCHGPSGEGKESMAKALKVTMRHLGSKEVQAKSDAELKKIITEGTGKMKGIKDIPPAHVDNVIAFVRTLAKK